MSNIVPGYLLKIDTWENDADNYKTEELQGLTADEVRFYIMIAECFKSGSNNGQATLGNTDIFSRFGRNRRSVDHTEYLDNKIAEWKAAGNFVPQDWIRNVDEEIDEDDDDYFYMELLYNLVGTWADGEYWRVFSGFTVHLVPEAIKDVTAEFRK
jgi:hypothetical protein